MKIKDRALKKQLMTEISECRARSSNVIKELRSIQDLSKISNEVIAKLNDMAYKAINKGSLQKMIDKRAMNNETLYQKLEKETNDMVSKLDFKAIAETNKNIVDEIGDCPLSCLNTIEAMKETDCMCIGLSISRPEAAIADPTRLVIRDIFPTYMTADSFLESAKFKIANAGDDEDDKLVAHGGFGKPADNQGQLALGLGREDITGIMPLYLFKEHWMIAKKRIQPVYGFMCTLDIMGYSSVQFYTIPFLVYMKALAKVR